jgi:hypothetical protein
MLFVCIDTPRSDQYSIVGYIGQLKCAGLEKVKEKMTGETFADVTELKVSDDCKGTTG